MFGWVSFFINIHFSYIFYCAKKFDKNRFSDAHRQKTDFRFLIYTQKKKKTYISKIKIPVFYAYKVKKKIR